MTENLNVTEFRNGDTIQYAETVNDWIYAQLHKIPAWCYPPYKSEKLKGSGRLYNQYAVTDPRGLAPGGWRIPNLEDLILLTRQLKGPRNAAITLKSKNGWDDIDLGNTGKVISGNGTNETGFNAKPIPHRDEMGEYIVDFTNQDYWFCDESQSKIFSIGSPMNQLICGDSLLITNLSKNLGLPVRCLKDADWENSDLPEFFDPAYDYEVREQLFELYDIASEQFKYYGIYREYESFENILNDLKDSVADKLDKVLKEIKGEREEMF